MLTPEVKVCYTCKASKLFTDFSKNKHTKDGYKYACKSCISLEYFTNIVKEKEKRKQHYDENKQAYKDRAKQWKTSNPERVYCPISSRKTKLKAAYGLSWEAFESLFEGQGGRCKICRDKKELWPEKAIDGLCVDHCHVTGRIRGLLCSRCNTGLGQFRDNPLFLKEAMEYLHVNL